jgi:hypothetical protein
MLKFKAALFAGLASALLVLPAYADTPEEAVRAIVQKMKSTGDLSPLVDQVDWDARFSQMSTDEKNALGFSSAEEMKEHYRSRATANGADIVEKFKKDQGAAKYTGSDPASEVAEEADRQRRDNRNRLSGTTYTVLRAENKGDGKYLVTVLKRYKEESEEVQMMMHQSGGSWLMDSGAALNPAPAKLAGGSPLGRMPEPVAVLGQP